MTRRIENADYRKFQTIYHMPFKMDIW